MMKLSSFTLREKFEALFTERQIYHRSNGQVRYWILTPKLQMAIMGTVTLIVGYCLFTLFLMAVGKTSVLPGNSDLAEVRAESQRMIEAAQAEETEARRLLAEQADAFEDVTGQFQQRHQMLAALMGDADTSLAMAAAAPEGSGERIMMSAVERDVLPLTSRSTSQASFTAHPSSGISNFLLDLEAMQAEQTQILLQQEQSAQNRIQDYRAVLARAGVPVDDIVETSQLATGGPLIEIASLGDEGDAFTSHMTRVAARINEAESLEQMLLAAPLAHPVEAPRLTSRFGRRIDPFSNKPAYHSGLDYGGARNTSIIASAPGVVSFVGRRDGYGKVVEIDHGHGFKTRYAHLHSTTVTRGATVEQGQEVGGMGSTGRSTSTHLHYEVWYKGRPVDPSNFVKAGSHVQ